MLQQNIDIYYILYAEKILVDPIDFTYPKPPLLGVLWFFLTFEKPHVTCSCKKHANGKVLYGRPRISNKIEKQSF